jgi:hypothetical protein
LEYLICRLSISRNLPILYHNIQILKEDKVLVFNTIETQLHIDHLYFIYYKFKAPFCTRVFVKIKYCRTVTFTCLAIKYYNFEKSAPYHFILCCKIRSFYVVKSVQCQKINLQFLLMPNISKYFSTFSYKSIFWILKYFYAKQSQKT